MSQADLQLSPAMMQAIRFLSFSIEAREQARTDIHLHKSQSYLFPQYSDHRKEQHCEPASLRPVFDLIGARAFSATILRFL